MAGDYKRLKSGVLFDIETLGLGRGEGTHEAAVFNLSTGVLNEYTLTPNLVQVTAATSQEWTKLATSAADEVKLIQSPSWKKIIHGLLQMEGYLGPVASDDEILAAIQQARPFLWKKLDAYPHLLDKQEAADVRALRARKFADAGVSVFNTTTDVTPEQFLKKGGILENELRGQTVWIANAAFESKQIGALVAGLTNEGVEVDLKSTLQTAGTTVDPYYVTGVNVNSARSLAQISGDWRGVWKAYLADMPKEGETAVRDVQDVLRAMRSYGQNLGLAAKGDVYWGTNLDLVYRLLNPGNLNVAESHRAAEDIAIHTKQILDKVLDWTNALQAVDENTAEGAEYLAQAANKAGPLYEVTQFFARQDLLKPEIKRVNLIKRVGRALEDMVDKSYTVQTDGISRVSHLTQATPGGGTAQVAVAYRNRVKIKDLQTLATHLASSGETTVEDIAQTASAITNLVPDDINERGAIARAVDTLTENVVNNAISTNADKLGAVDVNVAARMRAESGGTLGKLFANAAAAPTALKVVGMGAAALAGLGMLSTWGRKDRPQAERSLLSENYQQWYDRQNAAVPAGMAESGIAGNMRSAYTDFGSPYQGMNASYAVFEKQKVLEERERYLRSEYGVTHYDNKTGLFASLAKSLNAFSIKRAQGYYYLPGATAVPNGYNNLNSPNLMSISLTNGQWQVTAEDADTVSVRQGGRTGAIQGLFGMRRKYDFRLAGVDSPEVQHGDQPGQPGGASSRSALAQMLSRGETELVFDPMQSTYGRSVGVLFQQGKNLNYELVQRGAAAHLGYRSKEFDPMINYSAMSRVEQAAIASGTGMWGNDYWKAYRTSVDAGMRSSTFAQLAKTSSLAADPVKANAVALMQQAQATGLNESISSRLVENADLQRARLDQVRPTISGVTASHYGSYMAELQADVGSFMSTHGTNSNPNYLSTKQYRKLDSTLSLDSLNTTNNVYVKSSLSAYSKYNVKNAYRRQQMAERQQAINNTVFNSQINHTRF